MKTADEILKWARTIQQWTGMLRTEPTEKHREEAERLALGAWLLTVVEEVLKKAPEEPYTTGIEDALIEARMRHEKAKAAP